MKRKAVDREALVKGIVAGDRRLMARALRIVDDDPENARLLAADLYPHRKKPVVIGVTGNPGAGKSTIVDKMIAAFRAQNKSVAVLAVDPSSPFSGGAILGDRIRMSGHFSDDGVYIRSLATRGALGGLSRSTFDSVRVLDAAGYDVILIETVGVGQDEVDVVRLADTTVVVVVPGLGDDVQAIKAGLLEIADVFLLNKSDRPGVDELEQGLRYMLSLGLEAMPWEPPMVRAVALRNEGIDTLLEKIAAHGEFLHGDDGIERKKHRRNELFQRILDAALVDHGRKRLGKAYDDAVQNVIDEAHDPYAEVLQLLRGLA